jgi:DNA end-binding protein Ku
MLEPRGKGILATTLHYPYEVRPDEPVFEAKIEGVEPLEEHVNAAERIIEGKAGHFEPLEDRYQKALRDLVKRKRKCRPQPAPPKASRGTGEGHQPVEALRKSIEADAAHLLEGIAVVVYA